MLRFLAVTLVVLVALAPLLQAYAITSAPITIDGDLSDWAGVRADPQNSSIDTQRSDPDPDYPSVPDRDVYLVNATWDADYLYLAFRRTSGGTKAIVFGAYIDLGGDGLLQNEDVVCTWKVNQSASGRFADAHAPSPTAMILRYNQAIVGKDGPYLHPGGDPMGYDGETPDGWADVQSGQILPQEPMDGWMAENGIEFEGRVAWDDLGVPAGSPISIHFVDAGGESFGTKWVPSDTHKWIGNPPQYLEENRGQVEDNIDDIWWLRLNAVDVAPDNTGGGEDGDTLVYPHMVKNSGNTTATFDLTAASSAGWAVAVTDTGDAPLAAVTLAPGATAVVRVHVTIPPGIPDGTKDTTTLTATSRSDSTVTDSAKDYTTAGRVTVTPDQARTMAPGQTILYTFTIANNLSGSTRTFDLATASTLGWDRTITDLNGTPVSSVALASGGTTQVVVAVSVPATATIGSQDVMRLTATLSGNRAVSGSATGATTVRAGLTVTPDLQAVAGVGAFVDYRHTVTNSWPETRTVTLSFSDVRSWPVRFYAPDGVTRITTLTIGPNGAAADFIARLEVPGTAGTGDADTTVVTATVVGAPTVTASATDRTTVRTLAIYDSGGYANQETTFTLTETAWARATGLAPGSQVYFIWRDTLGYVRRTSSLRTVDTGGMAFDSYPTLPADETGPWVLELYSSKDAPLETSAFSVKWKAAITALSATDAPSVGGTVSVTASVENRIGRDITGSTMTYVIWWDENGDGVFGAGDVWIDSAGAPHAWDGVSAVSTHVTPSIDVTGNATWSESSPWTVANTLFPNQGTYRVTATWTEGDGTVIDTKTSEFYSIPALGWPLSVLAALSGAAWLWRRRERPAGAGPAVVA